MSAAEIFCRDCMAESNYKIPTEFDTEIYRTLNDIENIIYFKWNLAEDKMEFTTPVESTDYDLPQSAFPASSLFFGSDLIHPDDSGEFSTFFDEMFWMQDTKNDYKYFTTKIRLRGKDNRGYLWAELRLLIYFNEVAPVMGFGCICNINVKQLWQMELQHSAEHDILTGFFNKVATQKHIEKYLDEMRHTDLLTAFLIIDADGFKAINDSFGHLFGDGVLTDMGLAIRNSFKPKDIIGRIGGDEFVVLCCEMESMDELDSRCKELLKTLDRNYESNNVKLPFSVSIGVSLYPKHGENYKDLFKRADRALYESKSLGKNRYSIYRSSLIGRNIEVTSSRDPQHSEDIRQKAFQDNMLEFILNLLYETQNPEATISLCLELFGKQYNLDRVVVENFNRSSNQYKILFEWTGPNGISLNVENPGEELSEMIDLRYNALSALYHPTAYGVMSICQNTFQRYPNDAEKFETFKLGSFAICQISHGGEETGCVGFESASPREYTNEELSKLSTFSVLLGNILLGKHNDKVSERINKHLHNILDHIQDFIYVVDKSTYEPIYFNSTIRQTLLTTVSEKTCYKRFHGLDKPCKGCPLEKLSRDGNEYIDVMLNNWGAETSARAYNIHWEDEFDKNLALIIQSSF